MLKGREFQMKLDQKGMGQKSTEPCKPLYNFDPYSKGKPLMGFTRGEG